jgi:hypothetical protein
MGRQFVYHIFGKSHEDWNHLITFVYDQNFWDLQKFVDGDYMKP